MTLPITNRQVLPDERVTGYSRPMNAAERVRRRAAELIEERGWTQAALAQSLGKTQPWMSKFLRGDLDLGLDELDQLAQAIGSTAVELVRDPEGFQFCADLTPSEMALLRRVRKLSPSVRDAVGIMVAAAEPAQHVSRMGKPTYVGPTPTTPAELSQVVSALAQQIDSFIAGSQADARRQVATARDALTLASSGRGNRRRRVPKSSGG